MQKEYGDDIRIVSKHYLVHPQTASLPAWASCAADKQGRFHDYENAVWDKLYKSRKFDKASLEGLASEMGFDMTKFKSDMEGACKKQVSSDMRDLQKFGARGTPAFFINGRFLSGARPYRSFKSIVDEELKKANDRIKKGTKPENYYAEWVMKKGKKSL